MTLAEKGSPRGLPFCFMCGWESLGRSAFWAWPFTGGRDPSTMSTPPPRGGVLLAQDDRGWIPALTDNLFFHAEGAGAAGRALDAVAKLNRGVLAVV